MLPVAHCATRSGGCAASGWVAARFRSLVDVCMLGEHLRYGPCRRQFARFARALHAGLLGKSVRDHSRKLGFRCTDRGSFRGGCMRRESGALVGAVIAGLVAVGCASSGDVNSVRNDAAEARRIAEEANRKADAAAADAAAARRAAESAADDA